MYTDGQLKFQGIMSAIATNLQAVRARLQQAGKAAGRDPATVYLLAVGKTWPTLFLHGTAAAGQRAFGEKDVQEAAAQRGESRGAELEWDFIGPILGNAAPVAEHVDWVRSIDRFKTAERLSTRRPAGVPPLQIYVRLNREQKWLGAGRSGRPLPDSRAPTESRSSRIDGDSGTARRFESAAAPLPRSAPAVRGTAAPTACPRNAFHGHVAGP